MKILFFTLIMALGLAAGAQELPINESGRVEFQKVIQVNGLNSDAIYLKVLDWFGETFRNPESAITFQNRETGKINGRFFESYASHRALGQQYYVDLISGISFEIKDHRIRVTINDFTTITNTQFESTFLNKENNVHKGYKTLGSSIIDINNNLFNLLEIYLNTEDNDDW